MKRIPLAGILEYDDDIMHGDDAEAREWFYDHVLGGDRLILHDNGDIGDALGAFTLTPNATANERLRDAAPRLAEALKGMLDNPRPSSGPHDDLDAFNDVAMAAYHAEVEARAALREAGVDS